MSCQRYSLSAQLTHIVCSRRHLPDLLSVMAGSVSSLLFVSPEPGPCENAHSWSWLGTNWRILTTKDGCFPPLPGRNRQDGRRLRFFCRARGTSWESPGVHSSQIFKKIFLVLGKAQLTIWTHLLGDDSRLAKQETKQRAA